MKNKNYSKNIQIRNQFVHKKITSLMSIKLKTLLDNCNILSLIITNSIMRSTFLLSLLEYNCLMWSAQYTE